MSKVQRVEAICALFEKRFSADDVLLVHHSDILGVLDIDEPNQVYYAAVATARDVLRDRGIYIGTIRSRDGSEGGYEFLDPDGHNLRNSRKFRGAVHKIEQELRWGEALIQRIEAGEDAQMSDLEVELAKDLLSQMRHSIKSFNSRTRVIAAVREQERAVMALEERAKLRAEKDKEKVREAKRAAAVARKSLTEKLRRRDRQLELIKSAPTDDDGNGSEKEDE